jgi:hypothetical protein
MILLASGVLLGAGSAAAAPPPSTPGDTEGGCKENGQAISGAAQSLNPFGQVVRGQAPISDNNAEFFNMFCDGDS